MTLDEIEEVLTLIDWGPDIPMLTQAASHIIGTSQSLLAAWWDWHTDNSGNPPWFICEAGPERMYEFASRNLNIAETMCLADQQIDLEEQAGFLAAAAPTIGCDTAWGHFDAAIFLLSNSLSSHDSGKPGDEDDPQKSQLIKERLVRLKMERHVVGNAHECDAQSEPLIELPIPSTPSVNAWYHDPVNANRERYWLNGSWSDHVRSLLPTQHGPLHLIGMNTPSTSIDPLPTRADTLARALLVASLYRSLASCHDGSGAEMVSLNLDDNSYIQWARNPSGVQLEIRAPRLLNEVGEPSDPFIAQRLRSDGWHPPDGDLLPNPWMPLWELSDCETGAVAVINLIVDALGFDPLGVWAQW